MGFITYFQLFGIGLSFGVAGPCFLSCTPFLIIYLAGKKLKWGQGLIEALVFLSARLFAYLVLGYLAGLSATLLRQFGNSNFILFLKPLGGLIIIILGVFILSQPKTLPFSARMDNGRSSIPPQGTSNFSRKGSILLVKEPVFCGHRFVADKVFTFGSLLTLGFIMGISPCAPLLALLFEITIISKTAFQGLLCALSFGLGTLISGFIVIVGLSGVISWLPTRFLRSGLSLLIFRIICVLILIFLGSSLIFSKN